VTTELPLVLLSHHLGMSSWRSRRFGVQAALTFTSPIRLLVESTAFIGGTFIAATFMAATFMAAKFIAAMFIAATFIAVTFIAATFIAATFIAATVPVKRQGTAHSQTNRETAIR